MYEDIIRDIDLRLERIEKSLSKFTITYYENGEWKTIHPFVDV